MKYINYNNIINENENKLQRARAIVFVFVRFASRGFPHYLAYFVTDLRCRFSVESRTDETCHFTRRV